MAQAPPSTETIALVFTDLVGSTELMADLGAGLADDVRRDHFARLQASVDRVGGRTVKNLGDGVMAVFGSASAAIDCAIAIQREVQRAGRRAGVRLSVRVGVAAGDVLIEDGDCFGAPVVESARLCDVAAGGQILATETVGRMASGRSTAELTQVEPMELKGIPDPVPVIEIGWSQASRESPSSAGSASLLEREGDLRIVVEAFEDAADGNGGVVVVEGPAGIGKTTLLDAVESGTVVALRARGAQLEQDYGWGVVRQLFERWLLDRSDEEREQLLRGAAEPARAALGQAVAQDEHPFAAVHGLYWLAMNAAERTPLVLTVDDAHWCDDASLRWLAYLASRVDGTPISLILGVRHPDPGAERESLLQIAAEPEAIVVRPAPLSAAATLALVTGRLDLADAQPIAAACHRATGGNPFLLRALLDDLAQSPDGRPPDPESVRGLRPAAISRAVLLRIGGLPREAHAVARAIAVLGGSATTARAAALTGHTPEVAGDGLAALVAGGIVEDRLPPVFVHPLVHAVILDDLSASERSSWHARAATVLRESAGRTDEIAAQLMHTEPTGDPAVVATLQEAAEGALAGGAPEASIGLLVRALAEPPPREAVANLQRLRGRALLRTRGAEGLDAMRAAVAAAIAPAERAEAALELARALEGLSRNPEAVDVYEAALADLDGADERQARELEAGLVTAAVQHLSTLPRGLEALGAAMQRPPRPDAADAIVKTALALATTAAGSPDGVEMAEAALASGRLFETEPSIAVSLAIAPLVWGDRLDAALSAWDEVVERAVARSEPLRLAFGLIFRGGVHLRAGRVADAEADQRAALDVPQEMWTGSAVPVDALALLAETLLERGGPDAAGGALEDLGAAERLSDYQGNSTVLMARGRIRLARGLAEEAADDLLELGRRCESWTLRNPAAYPWRSQAAIALRGTDPDRARELIEEELELARAFGAAGALGVGLRAAGLVHGGDEGIALLEEGVEVLATSPVRLEHAHALVDLGAAQRQAGRREAARVRLAEGLDGAVVCGSTPLAEYARAELALAGARPRRDRVTGRDALTPSELRVVRIAIAGRSNREIAEQLWVTLKTVETHLSRAYRKLGIKTRQELEEALSEAVPRDHANDQGGNPDAAVLDRG
jgi:class 3 adenylate cyclase/DNA-binding CsgD family transcriptional regulator